MTFPPSHRDLRSALCPSLIRRLTMLVAVAGVLLGCRKASDPVETSPDAVAWVGGRPLPASALEAELQRRSAGGLPHDQQQVLDELVELEAAYGKAIASGFLDQPEIQRAIRLLVVDRLRASRPVEPALASGPAEERARALYAANTNRFLKAEVWNVAWIRVESPRKATPEKKAEALARARDLRARAEKECRGMPHFGALAASVSADQATRFRGGELGWMTAAQMEARMDPAVVAAVLRLESPGVVAEPVVAADGIYLLKLMARRPAQLRPFDEVRPQLDHELALNDRRDRDARWSRWAREGVEVRLVPERLARIAVPAVRTKEAPVPTPAPMETPR